jgi:hypothetical protein
MFEIFAFGKEEHIYTHWPITVIVLYKLFLNKKQTSHVWFIVVRLVQYAFETFAG